MSSAPPNRIFRRILRSASFRLGLIYAALFVVSRSQLEDALFEFGAEVESNAVEVYVSRLRKKIAHPLIQTSRGMGYRLAKP
jgi:DNA-binding response OmpR family regulator